MRRSGSIRGLTGRRGAGAPSAAAWTPARLFGVGESDGLWLDSSTVTLVSTDVDVWVDRSSYGNDFTAPSAAARPSWNSSDANFGGRPSLTFDSSAVERLLASTSSILDLGANEAIEIVAVHKISGVTAGGRVLDKRSTDGYLISENSTTGLVTVYDTNLSAGAPSVTYATAGVTRGDVLLQRGFYNPDLSGGGYAVLINGTSSTLATAGQGGSPSTTDVATIGATDNGALPFDGEMVFLLVRIGVSLSTEEKTQLLTYLNERFGQSFPGI